jgi:dTDP-4-dehydrorhamnose reductase
MAMVTLEQRTYRMTQHPILILGATGQVARALKELLGYKAYAAGRDECDFTKPEMVDALMDRVHPSIVINAVAYTQVDKAETERDLAFQINAHTPAHIARLCAQRTIPLVHYSTDYVFDGKGNTPHRPEDACAPLNVYGASKRAGEEAIMAAGGSYLIFRTSWVYDAHGKNFLTTMLRLGKEREELSIVSDQIGSPTYAPHIAGATLDALLCATHEPSFPSGIYHMCNQGETSWHGFAEAIFAHAKHQGMELMVQRCHAIPSSAYPTPASRPNNSRLDCSTLAEALDVTMPHWQDGLEDAMQHIER